MYFLPLSLGARFNFVLRLSGAPNKNIAFVIAACVFLRIGHAPRTTKRISLYKRFAALHFGRVNESSPFPWERGDITPIGVYNIITPFAVIVNTKW